MLSKVFVHTCHLSRHIAQCFYRAPLWVDGAAPAAITMSNSSNMLRRCAPLSLLLLAGCTGICEYLHNGCKVGHNYKTPCAPIATSWIDAADKRIDTGQDDLATWWTVFNDPVLN